MTGNIRAGMGGWTFEPWEGTFYPEKLSKAKQLQFASSHVPTIEVNGTYYSSFKEPTFLKWASEAPDGFVYALKGNRFVTNRRVLGEAGESMTRFRLRRCRTWRQARPDPVAVCADQEIRRSRLRRLPQAFA